MLVIEVGFVVGEEMGASIELVDALREPGTCTENTPHKDSLYNQCRLNLDCTIGDHWSGVVNMTSPVYSCVVILSLFFILLISIFPQQADWADM